jgi:hypothetical protein
VISLKIEAVVQGYTKAAFPVSIFRNALAATLDVASDSIAVLSVEDLPARRGDGSGVRVTSVVTFPAGSDTAAGATRLVPEALTRNLQAGGMAVATVAMLVCAILDPAVQNTTFATTPVPAQAITQAAESGLNIIIGKLGVVICWMGLC